MCTWFSTKKGLKQGNPLSPLLSIMVADSLRCMLQLAISGKLLEPVGLDNISSLLHSLQYIDNTVLFCNTSRQQLDNIKRLLYLYEILTGLKINFSQSHTIRLCLRRQKVQGCIAILGCGIASFPIQYLGIPLHYKTLPVNG